MVRFKIGDTDTTSQLLSNEEIDAILTENDDAVVASSIVIAEALAAKYARLSSTSIEGLSVDFKAMADNFRRIADRLSGQASTSAVLAAKPFVGGLVQSTMDSVANEPDRAKQRVRVGFSDYDHHQGLDDNP